MSKHIWAMLGFVGAGVAAWYGWKWYKLRSQSGDGTGTVPTADVSTSVAVNNAAHADTGDGESSNVYDAVLGVASIVGGVVSTGLSRSTGGVEDDTANVIDRQATLRAEPL